MLNGIKMLMLMMLLCLFIACGGGGSGNNGDAPASCDDGCLIADVCHTDGATNPENPCQICSVSIASDGWSDNDGASCDDGNFCTTGDSCLAGSCSESSASPCGAGEICLEDEDTCCLSGIPEYLA